MNPKESNPYRLMMNSTIGTVKSTILSTATSCLPAQRTSESSWTMSIVSSHTRRLLRSEKEGALILRCRFHSSPSVTTMFEP